MSTPIKCLKYRPRYFKEEEFRKALPSCSLSDMSEQLMRCLDAAREYAGIPFVIASAYRSVEHELAKGRAGTSSHCKGLAVDITCRNSINRLKVVRGLLKAGFVRIGVSDYFIHADMDYDKPQCMWTYGNDFFTPDDL